jgi:6-phosphofructokinase 1
MEGRTQLLNRQAVRGITHRGGTILGTSRVDPYVHGQGLESVHASITENDVEVLVVVGGDGSLRAGARLEADGLKVIGVPKTIDNDIGATDASFGFDTAVQIVTDALDRLTTTAEAHDRIMVVEVMGRHSGWIALYSGLAAGAEAILIPEVPYDLDRLSAALIARHEQGRDYSMVVVAEGVADPRGNQVMASKDQYGFERYGGVAIPLAEELERRTGFETRAMILGHLQRGGAPTAYDRILATRMGVKAADLALEGASGLMVALQGTEIVTVDLAAACSQPRLVPSAICELARWFTV